MASVPEMEGFQCFAPLYFTSRQNPYQRTTAEDAWFAVAFCMPIELPVGSDSISLVCRSIQILPSYTAIPSVGERGSRPGTRNT